MLGVGVAGPLSAEDETAPGSPARALAAADERDAWAVLAGVQTAQRGRPRNTAGLCGRSQGGDGEYRNQKEQQCLRRTVCGMVGSHGFR